MVLLTMTSNIVAALEQINEPVNVIASVNTDPSLAEPTVGHPISHAQLIAVAKHLRDRNQNETHVLSHLDRLLRGSKIYIEPSQPKAQPTSEYTTLMARLRREEEARAYERMINPPPPLETFAQRFPGSAGAALFPASQADVGEEDDEVAYADINRQMTLIVNILISIVACSVAIWLAARHWNTPARLGLSMGGSGMIGVAEVVVYAGYLRRIKEARKKGQKQVETKEIIKTWVIRGEDEKGSDIKPVSVETKFPSEDNIRRRNPQNKMR